MEGRFNSFQRTMLQWNALHPYNAVHGVRVPAVFDPVRVSRLTHRVVEGLGLTGLELDLSRGRWRFTGPGGPPNVQVLPAAADAFQVLAPEAERELNLAFSTRERFTPFRFFALPEGGCFWLGVTYFHPIADAEPIVLLLKEWVTAYLAGSDRPLERFQAAPPSLTALRTWPGALRLLPERLLRMRTCSRPHYRDAQDLSNGVLLFRLQEGMLERLQARARALGVTLNDVWLGALMKALSPLAPHRLDAPRRRNLAIGCVANIRRDLGLEGRRCFGVHLGSFLVWHAVPNGLSLPSLLRDVHTQTAEVKARRLALHAAVEFAVGRFLLSFFSPRQRKTLYQKHYPLWGGVTNVNVNRLWEPRDQPDGLRYFRSVSTGSATPLVLSVTTLGSAVELGLSYRATVFSSRQIERVRAGFLDELEGLCGTS